MMNCAKNATQDFWRRCDADPIIEYPEIVEPTSEEITVEVNREVNQDIEQLIHDYQACLNAKVEQEQALNEVKDALQLYLASLDPEDKNTIHAKCQNGTTITWKKVIKKAQPDKVVEAKPESSYRKLIIKEEKEITTGDSLNTHLVPRYP